PPDLSEIQREIYSAVFLDGRSHREAYEIIASRGEADIGFSGFRREVRETYRLTGGRTTSSSRLDINVGPVLDDLVAQSEDPARGVERADAARHISSGLESL